MCVERTLVQTLTPFLITSNTFADIVRMAILTSLIDVDLLNRIIDSDIVTQDFDLRMWLATILHPDISALILLYPTSACYIMLDQPLLLYPP